MKKWLSLFLFAVVLLFAASGCDKTEEGNISVSVTDLQFVAVSANQRNLIVTAENVTWDYAVSEDAQSWLSVDREGDILFVTVADNDTKKDRNGFITVTPDVVSDLVEAISIPVMQKGNPKATIVLWNLAPGEMIFYSHKTSAKYALAYESGRRVECRAEVDNVSANDWIHVVMENDGITVTVDDNTTVVERTGFIRVTPLDKRMYPKKIRVSQYGLMKRPTIKIIPADYVLFKATDDFLSHRTVTVNLTNSSYSHSFVDENGKNIPQPSWVEVGAPLGPVNIYFFSQWTCVKVLPNEEPDARYAYLKISTSGFPPCDDDPTAVLRIIQGGTQMPEPVL